ncbi:gliding motility-associated C-terminal domain-containing protein [Paracrocinitomix mangrovi]|uniref:lectin-like domain-containing protein n=1 Tax=Paracrocinitomix mangrovi TaxID=2862509 RepID=UPI001C8D87E1|nr:gliding motility-associated C-terminal domain-containing protein [Paracrocinitomix mangrovi]UKN03529.1 gliding motility-associated C-terminal domain-containing protein [Paracrocinitomix mangrovi]
MIRYAYVLTIVLLTAMSNSFGQYAVSGNATTGPGCNEFTITSNTPNQTGGMYGTTQLNLTTAWSLKFSVNFGCDNFGGEGMAFVLQPGAWTLGTGGFGLGYQGLTNTLAVEFDTRDNQASGQTTNWDVPYDHIALMGNGIINHNDPVNTALTGVSTIDPTPANDVEDCQNHIIEITWTPGATQTLEVYYDGMLTLTETSNMITNNLGGATNVTWGWTGATSAFSNEQTVQIAIEPDFTYSPTNCPGQVINFTATTNSQYPIVQYDWDFDGTPLLNGGPNPSHTFATAGNHPVTLTITDNQGCTNSVTIDIGVGFMVDVTADLTTICPGTSTQLHAQGIPFVGNTCCFELHCYDIWDDWNGAEVEIFVDGTSQGTYTATDGGGMPSTTVFNMCFPHGSDIDMVINGTGSPQESSVFMVDESGDTVAQILSNFLSGSTTWYNGATAQFTVDCGITPPAYTYSWNNGGFLDNANIADPTCTISSATTFTVDVTDPGTGCVIQENITINTYTPGTISISGTPTVCEGDLGDLSVSMTGPTPYDFTISGPGGPYNITGITSSPYTFSNANAGTFTISSATSAGCPIAAPSGSGTITVIIPPDVDIESNNTYCDGDPINPLNVVSTNGGTVEWYNNPGLTGAPLATGNSYTPSPVVGTNTYYAIEAESVLGCTGDVDSVIITVNPVPIEPTWTGQTVWCEGVVPTTLLATASMGGNITWYDADPALGPANVLSTNPNFNPSFTPGTWSLFVTETANGCEGPAEEITYTVKPTPPAPTVTGQTGYCEGETPTALTATPSLGGQIDWYNSLGINLGTGTTYTPGLTAGTSIYYVYETLNGCESDSTEVEILVQPAPTVDVPDSVGICKGDSTLVTAINNGYDISWDDGQLGASVYLGPDSTSWFVVTADNPSCGFSQDSILVIVYPLPLIYAGNDTLIGIGGEVTMWATSPSSVTLDWIPSVEECVEGDCSIVYDVPDQATVYVVFATDKNGCVNTDSVLVDINGYMDVFVPNIFSPNGDGWNDVLEIKGPRLFNFTIEIYDRWGKRVYYADEQKDFWDGTMNGKPLEPQTFVYMLKGETVLGDKIVIEGNVSIIK